MSGKARLVFFLIALCGGLALSDVLQGEAGWEDIVVLVIYVSVITCFVGAGLIVRWLKGSDRERS